MSSPSAGGRRLGDLGRFLEIQTLGLNVPFALGFVFVAAGGLPRLVPFVLIVVAFVAARNAGHAFNRWTDRAFDAANPRTADRALPQGRLSPRFALVTTAASALVVLVAAGFLNPLALALAPVALALVLGYSYTKRVSSLSTVFLGLVQAITPAAAFVALDDALPVAALLAVGGILAWGTAFETIHSLGDLDSDRQLGLRSLPARLGATRSVQLVAVLHGIALALLGAFGIVERLRLPYYVALLAIAAGVAWTDRRLAADPTEVRPSFQRHFLYAGAFLVGVAVAVFVPWP
ncbi:MAG TPA: 4-hydroxybenzoate octaprenyltransferase [Thermoplasmata archaeon]|nr:4-hydroxybenzoate octaprenyltransferase [Thermoplasmata archaeon]